jgi:hypothetical protein
MRWLALLAGALVASLSACALQPTEITDGGGRVTRISPAHPYVFFYVNGSLRPLPRDRVSASPATDPFTFMPPPPTAGLDDPRSVGVWYSLESLRDGPTAAERAAGVTTALPDRVALASLSVGDQAVLIGVGFDSPDLPETALAQLSCTVTSAMSEPGRTWTGTVTLVKGTADTRLVVAPCDTRYLEALPYAA